MLYFIGTVAIIIAEVVYTIERDNDDVPSPLSFVI